MMVKTETPASLLFGLDKSALGAVGLVEGVEKQLAAAAHAKAAQPTEAEEDAEAEQKEEEEGENESAQQQQKQQPQQRQHMEAPSNPANETSQVPEQPKPEQQPGQAESKKDETCKPEAKKAKPGTSKRSGKRARPFSSSSKYRGVSWFKANQVWKAQITVNGKYEYLGYFEREEDAAWAYDIRALEVHGRNAQLNFPDHIAELRAAQKSGVVPGKVKSQKRGRNKAARDVKAAPHPNPDPEVLLHQQQLLRLQQQLAGDASREQAYRVAQDREALLRAAARERQRAGLMARYSAFASFDQYSPSLPRLLPHEASGNSAGRGGAARNSAVFEDLLRMQRNNEAFARAGGAAPRGSPGPSIGAHSHWGNPLGATAYSLHSPLTASSGTLALSRLGALERASSASSAASQQAAAEAQMRTSTELLLRKLALRLIDVLQVDLGVLADSVGVPVSQLKAWLRGDMLGGAMAERVVSFLERVRATTLLKGEQQLRDMFATLLDVLKIGEDAVYMHAGVHPVVLKSLLPGGAPSVLRDRDLVGPCRMLLLFLQVRLKRANMLQLLQLLQSAAVAAGLGPTTT